MLANSELKELPENSELKPEKALNSDEPLNSEKEVNAPPSAKAVSAPRVQRRSIVGPAKVKDDEKALKELLNDEDVKV